jgi:hypothetical protein
MPSGNPSWVPGHKPNGHRPVGSRNRRTKEILDRLQARGDKDPVDFLSEIVTNANNQHDPDIRLQAAGVLAPYLHSKTGAMPPLRYIEEPIELPNPNPTTDGEISTNIAHINQAFAAGRLDLDFYNALLAGQREHVVCLKAAPDDNLNAEQVIRIEGGLPELVGTDIIMPKLNGHEISGTLAAPAPVIDSAPTNEEPT